MLSLLGWPFPLCARHRMESHTRSPTRAPTFFRLVHVVEYAQAIHVLASLRVPWVVPASCCEAGQTLRQIPCATYLSTNGLQRRWDGHADFIRLNSLSTCMLVSREVEAHRRSVQMRSWSPLMSSPTLKAARTAGMMAMATTTTTPTSASACLQGEAAVEIAAWGCPELVDDKLLFFDGAPVGMQQKQNTKC